MARPMLQMGMMLIITLLPLQMLSGGLTPRESMLDLVQNLMLAAPTSISSTGQAGCATGRVGTKNLPRKQALFPPDLALMFKDKTNSGQPPRPQG